MGWGVISELCSINISGCISTLSVIDLPLQHLWVNLGITHVKGLKRQESCCSSRHVGIQNKAKQFQIFSNVINPTIGQRKEPLVVVFFNI